MLKFISLLIISIFIWVVPSQAKEEDEFLAKNFLNLGIKAYEGEKIGPAIYYLRQAISIQPTLSEAYSRLGSAYYRNGMIDEAIASYKKAIELNPDDAQTRNNLGVSYYLKGMADEAITQYKEALRIAPKDSKAHNNLGVIYYARKQVDLAMAEYKEALNIVPNDVEIQVNIGALYYDKGLLDEAISVYKKVIKSSPQNSYAYFCLGLAYATSGDLKKAREGLQLALQYNKEYEEASSLLSLLNKPESLFLNLGDRYCKRGEYDIAITLYNRVLKINPNCQDVYRGLSLAYAQKAKMPTLEMELKPAGNESKPLDTLSTSVVLTSVAGLKEVEINREMSMDPSPMEQLIAYKGIVQPSF